MLKSPPKRRLLQSRTNESYASKFAFKSSEEAEHRDPMSKDDHVHSSE